MPVGSFSFTPTPVPLGRLAPTTGVFLNVANDGNYVLYPNIVFTQIDRPSDGPSPGTAQFRYKFGDPFLAGTGVPERFEEVISQTQVNPYVLQNDNRVTVLLSRDDGSTYPLFDGFTQIPQTNVGQEGEIVTFQALGTPIREWDTPLAGSLWRDASTPHDVTANQRVDLPARFNPDSSSNCSPEGADRNDGQSNAYPVFMEDNPNSDSRRWTIANAAKYIIREGNPNETYIRNPDSDDLDSLLNSRKPVNDTIDPDDPSTYTDTPIDCPDIDVTGVPWPEALAKLLTPFGFGFRFNMSLGQDDGIDWELEVYRKDVDQNVKTVSMQEVGADLDPGQSNVNALTIARDLAETFNTVQIDSALTQYEASFVLVPLFSIAGADANTDQATRDKWKKDTSTFDPVAYRRFGVDELGDGFWDFAGGTLLTGTPFDFSKLFQKPGAKGSYLYVDRRRPAKNTLFSQDSKKNPYKAVLHISKDYAGTIPGIWDGTGTWQQIQNGGWELDKDRLGINLTINDARDWNIGKTDIASPVARGGKLNVVKSLASSDSANPRFYFRLTCVIEGDQDLDVSSKKRISSPTRFPITRHVDTRDRFVHKIIDTSSPYNSEGKQVDSLDETDNAQAYSDAVRKANENSVFAGVLKIPRLTTAYNTGDAISMIRGRDVDFICNAGAEQKEGPVYPTIAKIIWTSSPIATHLYLTDTRAQAYKTRLQGVESRT